MVNTESELYSPNLCTDQNAEDEVPFYKAVLLEIILAFLQGDLPL